MFERFFLYRHERDMNKLMKSGILIGKNTLLFNEAYNFGSCPELVSIGSNCVVASGVQFITNPDILKLVDPNSACGGRTGNNKDCEGRIIIRDNCFIGMDSIIYPNVVIGPNTVIGAGSVVMSDVAAERCACGNPCRVTCTLEFYARACKRGIVPDYKSDNKRNLLQEYFWNQR